MIVVIIVEYEQKIPELHQYYYHCHIHCFCLPKALENQKDSLFVPLKEDELDCYLQRLDASEVHPDVHHSLGDYLE